MSAFPDAFVWGAGTSAYQIEGGVNEDGRGPSVWDVFCAEPGRVRNGDNGDVACDHRHRMKSDVALMASLGLRAYRFSIAWPRVQPHGTGAVSRSGLDFYSELVDELLSHDITPYAGLYHWDLPYPLEEAGGWPSRDTAYRLAEYASIVGSTLGDRVSNWGTVNEPWCSSMLGYASGVHAPGRFDWPGSVRAAHHLLLGHGMCVDALRSAVSGSAEITLSLNPYPVVPVSSSPEDLDAARRVDGVANRLWYDAVLRAAYPDDVLNDFSSFTDLSFIRDGDMAQIARPIDALGINYYRRYHARFEKGASAGPPSSTWPGSPDVGVVEPRVPHTDGGWAIEPEGLRETLVRVRDEYGDVPLYVHENGAAFNDGPVIDGVVQDLPRVAFLDAHLQASLDAIADGVNLQGYFAWSLMDNFEWAQGYAHRFGIVHVDFETQERTLKTSALRLREIIRNNAL